MKKKKVGKMGSSMAVPLTKEFKEVGIEVGDKVNVHVLNPHNNVLIGKNNIDNIFELLIDKDVFRRFKFELEEEDRMKYKEIKNIVTALVSQWVQYQQKDWYDKPLSQVIKESFFKD